MSTSAKIASAFGTWGASFDSEILAIEWHPGLQSWVVLHPERQIRLVGKTLVGLEELLPRLPDKRYLSPDAPYHARFFEDGSLRFLSDRHGLSQLSLDRERTHAIYQANNDPLPEGWCEGEIVDAGGHSETYVYQDGLVERFSCFDDLSRPYPVDLLPWLESIIERCLECWELRRFD